MEGGRRAPPGQRSAASALRLAAGALRRLPAPLAYACADVVTPVLCAWGLAHELRAARRGRGVRRFATRPPHERPGADGLPPRSAHPQPIR